MSMPNERGKFVFANSASCLVRAKSCHVAPRSSRISSSRLLARSYFPQARGGGSPRQPLPPPRSSFPPQSPRRPGSSWGTSFLELGPIPQTFYVRHDSTILTPQFSGTSAWAGLLSLTGINLYVFLLWNTADADQNDHEDDDDDFHDAYFNARRRRTNDYYGSQLPPSHGTPTALTRATKKDREEWMLQNFAADLTNIQQGRPWSLLLASVSHQNIPHLAGNMFAMWLFGFGTYRVLGTAAFYGLYIAGGMACSTAHLLHNIITGRTGPILSSNERHTLEKLMHQIQTKEAPYWSFEQRHALQQYMNRPHLSYHEQQMLERLIPSHVHYYLPLLRRMATSDKPSLGASGSVMAISAASAALFPLDRVRVGAWYYLPLPLAVSLFVASDLSGLTQEGDPVDHAGHLGGLLMGMAYVTYAWHSKWGIFRILHNHPTGGQLPIVYQFRQFMGREGPGGGGGGHRRT